MSIEHIIVTLRYVTIAFLLGKISRFEAKNAYDCAMLDYQSWTDRCSLKDKNCIEILSNNLTQTFAECE